MKRFWLGVLWTFLLLLGVRVFVFTWDEDLDTFLNVLVLLPIGFWSTWTFQMLYDIWTATQKEKN